MLFAVKLSCEKQNPARKSEECCRNDIRYMWLLEEKRPPDHSPLSKFRQKELPGLLEEVDPKLIEYRSKIEETDYKTI